jgi:outer membrane protein TolC
MGSFKLRRQSSPLLFAWTICLAVYGKAIQARPIYWSDIKATAKNAPRAKAAEAEVSAVESQYDSAAASNHPKVYSTLVASRSVDTSSEKSANTHSAQITLEQELFSFGRDTAAIKSAERALDAAKKNRTAASVAFRAEVAKAWNNALYFSRLIEISTKAAERRRSNIQIVALRYNSGRESKGSLLSTEFAGKEALIDAKEAQEKSKLARSNLALLIGAEFSNDDMLAGELSERKPNASPVDVVNLPQIQASIAKVAAAQSQLDASRKKHYPDLTFNASAKKTATPDLPLNDPVYSASITLTVPLYDAKTNADNRAAIAKLASSESELAIATATASQKLQDSKVSLDLASERLENAKLGFEAAKLQAEVSRQRYTLGLMSFQDWDSFESAFIRSETKLLEQEKNFADAQTAYLESLGVSMEDSP